MIIGIDASRAVTGQRTGTEAYAFFLVQALIPLAAQRGHQIRLYFNQPPPPELFPENDFVEHITIPFPRLWTHVRLAWELYLRPPDLFFTPAHVIPYTYHGPSVVTVHDLGYHYFPEAHPPRQLSYLRWSTRHNGRTARRIIADSEATKNDLIRFDEVEPDKIDVVYPGRNPALRPLSDRMQTTAVLQKYGITPPYLLFLSTLQPRKNLVRLIQAYTAANVLHQLVLAGKIGWLAEPILAEINNQSSIVNRQSSIVTPGFIDDDDKAALLSGATALLYPSLHEGFGFPVLEAQACGAPVLCANSSSLPEVAGDAALLVNPEDTAAITAGIKRLVSDPLLRHELALTGLENVRRFTWEATAVQVLNVLEKAV
ncbi:MAG: glycosyltransferase family 4 protein [Ardenticatenaceae bacterium]|nr:glycosyltransferase family 4 protein [Ardenticatenaceae bacterium]MCB9444207.1 glycosyltransferase family 4 protein [Ardenticatenaceae bacterium]